MMRQQWLAAVLVCLAWAGSVLVGTASRAAEFKLVNTADGVLVNLDGKLFTEYVTCSGKKPILWPIIGPTGDAMTRAYPMYKLAREVADHPHHRSLWFTHGNVNGVDFWSEGPKAGSIVHREFVKTEGGKEGKIVTINDWISPKGDKICEDERTITFSTDGDNRIIDFDIVIKATDGPVKFGDTKEGSFGVRLPDDTRVDAKKGGRIVNSDGQVNGAAWGKRAAWVDCHGPVNGKTAGIAILNHPSSFGYPTPWHVRTYGLFAANPFGLHDFDPKSGARGDHTIKPGETMTLRYRVILHRGDEKKGRIAQSFESYAKQGRPTAQQGAPKLVPVSGQVLIDGQPLQVGTVRFVPEKGRSSTGKLDKEGRFSLSTFEENDGVVPGNYRVQIDGSEWIGNNQVRWHIPKKYANFNTSGLQFTVNEPANSMQIDLTWDGGKPFIEAGPK